MSLGPIEMFVFGFPELRLSGEMAPPLADLVDSGTIRIVDLLFLAKDGDGTVSTLEVDELDDDVSQAFRSLADAFDGLIGEEDVEAFAEELDPGSAMALVVVEHLWAKPFAEAVASSGGLLMGALHVPRDVVEELTA